jgi:hypothetical protein
MNFRELGENTLLVYLGFTTTRCQTEVGKFTLKSIGDEALSKESLLKSNGEQTFNDDFS